MAFIEHTIQFEISKQHVHGLIDFGLRIFGSFIISIQINCRKIWKDNRLGYVLNRL